MDEVVKKLKGRPRYDAHAEIFRKNLTIDTIPLDLASMESVFLFTEEANRRYIRCLLQFCRADFS